MHPFVMLTGYITCVGIHNCEVQSIRSGSCVQQIVRGRAGVGVTRSQADDTGAEVGHTVRERWAGAGHEHQRGRDVQPVRQGGNIGWSEVASDQNLWKAQQKMRKEHAAVRKLVPRPLSVKRKKRTRSTVISGKASSRTEQSAISHCDAGQTGRDAPNWLAAWRNRSTYSSNWPPSPTGCRTRRQRSGQASGMKFPRSD